jgi:hypothetical protein
MTIALTLTSWRFCTPCGPSTSSDPALPTNRMGARGWTSNAVTSPSSGDAAITIGAPSAALVNQPPTAAARTAALHCVPGGDGFGVNDHSSPASRRYQVIWPLRTTESCAAGPPARVESVIAAQSTCCWSSRYTMR